MKIRFDRMMRRTLLLLLLGLLPLLGTGSKQVMQGLRELREFTRNFEVIQTSWRTPDAGLEATLFDIDAGKFVSRSAYGAYAVSDAFRNDSHLYVGTVTAAWPAKPDENAHLRLRLTGESQAGCKRLHSTSKFVLDDCR